MSTLCLVPQVATMSHHSSIHFTRYSAFASWREETYFEVHAFAFILEMLDKCTLITVSTRIGWTIEEGLAILNSYHRPSSIVHLSFLSCLSPYAHLMRVALYGHRRVHMSLAYCPCFRFTESVRWQTPQRHRYQHMVAVHSQMRSHHLY